NWAGVGKMLNSEFGTSDVVIATTAAGAIPYYSELETVDMLGINDRYVARNGYSYIELAGHRVRSPLNYLISQDVNLLIAHPEVLRKSSDSPTWRYQDRRSIFIPFWEWRQIPESAQFLELPMGTTHILLVIYLSRHPDVEELIRRENLITWPIEVISNS
ncbi:MAG: hypothetical protein O7G86_13135, partial [Gammaproteobacteria bacterium]|nr:hypothetical protein [Gammaproteobacteria bacterium]